MKLLAPLKERRRKATQLRLERLRFSGSSVAPTRVSPLFFLLMGVSGLAFIVLAEFFFSPAHPKWALVCEHIGIAFCVAVVLGMSYEYYLHTHREEMFAYQLEVHRAKMFDALQAHFFLTPEKVFSFVGQIAIQTRQTPTLYKPSREEGTEYTFSSNLAYFNTLLEVRRPEIVKVLSDWIAVESHSNLKFLASDFVGMYRISELAHTLRSVANRELDQLSESNRGWAMNYVWAASCCEEDRFHWLTSVLCDTDDEWIQLWILFVPRQMQDPKLGEMIDTFLKTRKQSPSVEVLAHSAHALASLYRANEYDSAPRLLDEYKEWFGAPDVMHQVAQAWKALPLPQSLRGKTVR